MMTPKIFASYDFLPGLVARQRMRGKRALYWDGTSAVEAYCDGRYWWTDGVLIARSIAAVPPPANVPLFSRVILDVPAVSGIKMRPVELICTTDKAGARAWLPNGPRVLFSAGGNDANPVLTTTAAAATGTIGTIGTIPGGLFATEGMRLDIKALAASGATATGTKTVAIQMDTAPAVVASGTLAANANSVQPLQGSVWARTPTTQSSSYTLGPHGSAGNVSASSSLGVSAGADIPITAVFSGATVGDIIQIVSYTVTIE